jgi:hypothetical protein
VPLLVEGDVSEMEAEVREEDGEKVKDFCGCGLDCEREGSQKLRQMEKDRHLR